MRSRAAAGFTLVEVLVALAVLAFALAALIKGGGEHAANAAYLRDRTLAGWVASNRLTELRLAAQWPATGKDDGRVTLATREWVWRTQVKKTPDKDIRRVDVEVAAADDDITLARMSAFLGNPAIATTGRGTQ